MLEVDDWAYELFIAQADILDDDEFDVVIVVQKNKEEIWKEKQKKLAWTFSIVVSSIMFFWILGWVISQI